MGAQITIMLGTSTEQAIASLATQGRVIWINTTTSTLFQGLVGVVLSLLITRTLREGDLLVSSRWITAESK